MSNATITAAVDPGQKSDAGAHDRYESYREGMRLYQAGAWSRAADRLEPLIHDPDLEGHLARYYHARACRKEAEERIEAGEVSKATGYLRRGLTSHPRCPSLLSYLADCYLRQGEYARAGTELSRLSRMDESNGALKFKEAMSHYLGGRTNQAVNILEELVQAHPNNFDVVYNLGMILAGREESNRAVEYLTKACNLRPEDSTARWKLGLAHGTRGHLTEAVHHLQKAHRLEPDNNWLLCHLTLAVDQARHLGLTMDLATAKIDQAADDPGRARLDRLAELIIREPDFVTAFLDLPRTEVDPQIFTELLKILMRALECHPEYADIHFHCSRVYERLNQPQEAIQATQKALDLNPRYVNALIHLAKLYAQTDRDQEAIHRLKTAVTLGGNYADVYYLLGKLYHRQGQLDQARRHYQRALSLNGRYREAREALESLAA